MSRDNGIHDDFSGVIYIFDEASEISKKTWGELIEGPILLGVDMAKPGEDFTGSRMKIDG